jgi:hypothetical protein
MNVLKSTERINGKQIMENKSETAAVRKHTGYRKDSDNSARVEDNRDSNGLVDITALIRSVQRSEGNPDCFDTSEGKCEQLDCAWRPYCLEGHPTPG